MEENVTSVLYPLIFLPLMKCYTKTHCIYSWSLVSYCYNPNYKPTSNSTEVGFDIEMTLRTPHHPPPHNTTQTQWQPLGASDDCLLTTTKYSITSMNNQNHKDHINNNNNKNDDINNNKLGLSCAKLRTRLILAICFCSFGKFGLIW